MDRLELHLSKGFIVILVLFGFVTCGMVPLILWAFAIRKYPKTLDREGVTLKNGERLLWKDLTKTDRLVVQTSTGKYVSGVGFTFGRKRVQIAPKVLAEGADVLPFLSNILGQDLSKP